MYAHSEESVPAADDAGWVQVVAKSKCEKDKEHAFPSTALLQTGNVVRYVKLVIIPDGGVKRFRVFGKRAM